MLPGCINYDAPQAKTPQEPGATSTGQPIEHLYFYAYSNCALDPVMGTEAINIR